MVNGGSIIFGSEFLLLILKIPSYVLEYFHALGSCSIYVRLVRCQRERKPSFLEPRSGSQERICTGVTTRFIYRRSIYSSHLVPYYTQVVESDTEVVDVHKLAC